MKKKVSNESKTGQKSKGVTKTPMLELIDVSKYFGGLAAVDNLSMAVNAGEIIGLVGPNGAGKTTIFNIVSGFYPPTHGKVIFNGRNITSLKPHQIAKLGLVRTFQLTSIFGDLTVLQNVFLGGHLHADKNIWTTVVSRAPAAEIEKSREILKFVGLAGVQDEVANNLPLGQQRILQLAVALATDPMLLMLDEPVSGMTHEEISTVMDLVRTINGRGVTILLVEHNMRAVMGICERIVVLNFGEKICEGAPDHVKEDKAVCDAYLGTEEYVT